MDNIDVILREFEKSYHNEIEMIKENIIICKKINDALEKDWLSLKDFAEKLDYTVDYVNEFMSGEHYFTDEDISKIEHVLGVRLNID